MNIEKCFITDEPIKIISDGLDDNFYEVLFAEQTFQFAFSKDHINSNFVDDNKYILKGLMVNKKFPISDKKIYNNERLESIINEANIPRSLKEKRDNLLQFLHSLQNAEGDEVNPQAHYPGNLYFYKLYFKGQREYYFYMATLKEHGLITFMEIIYSGGIKNANRISLTYKGLSEVISLQEEGILSKNCFVAMWFSHSLNQVRDSIKEAILECNYTCIIIDEIPIESDKTINDAIISNLKKSKFVVADFTGQRPGVYFEAGFALGQGKQVIYLCQEDDFDKCHFDTNHYPHVFYKDHNDLKEKLINRIQAWID